MSTKKTLTITALVFVAGMSGIVLGLPSIPQATADGGTTGNFGLCNSLANAVGSTLDPTLNLSGKDLADARKAYCG